MLFNLNRGGFGERSFQWVGTTEFERDGTDFMFALGAGSGTLRLLRTIVDADICLIGGGRSAGHNRRSSSGGGEVGGDGGEVVNVYNVSLPAGNYSLTVGASDQDTVLEAPDGRTWTARTGYGAYGGTGGYYANAEDGSLAFDDENTLLRPGWIYGSGGGRGLAQSGYDITAATSGGDIGTADAADTWGHGGVEGHLDGYPGFPGSGQGGGGLGRIDGDYGSIGLGGAGSVLIRKHKEGT